MTMNDPRIDNTEKVYVNVEVTYAGDMIVEVPCDCFDDEGLINQEVLKDIIAEELSDYIHPNLERVEFNYQI